MGKRIFAVFLALFMMMSVAAALCVGSGAEDVIEDNTPTRVIAIVFDNSGSMFIKEDGGVKYDPMAWCRATYAIEVFASMLNEHEGRQPDKLLIYPMNQLSAGGDICERGKNIVVTAGDENERALIRDFQTANDGGTTPIESIDWAKKGLDAESADEKWLIILTDGVTFHNGGVAMDTDDTKSALEGKISACLEDDVNVAYLGIGKDIKEPSAHGKNTTYISSVARNATDITKKLSEMCNSIFGRAQLRGSYFKNNKDLNFDVSMRKLIVFLQGKDISGVKLKDSDGKVIEPSKTVDTRYSDKGVAESKYNELQVDKDLQGVVVTYEGCDSGEYTLDYKGNNPVVDVYYEPNVELRGALYVIEGGQETEVHPENGEPLPPGEYVFRLALYDKGVKDGEGALVESDLIGDPEYHITYTLKHGDGDGGPTGIDGNEAHITLQEGDELGAEGGAALEYSVNYLENFTIHKDSTHELKWPGFISIPVPPADLKITVDDLEGYYTKSSLDGASFVPKITLDGQPLTDEELKDKMTTVSDIPLEEPELIPGESAYRIKFKTDGGIDSGKYNITLKLENITDPAGNVLATKEDYKTEVGLLPIWLKVLLWAVGIALFLALAAFICTRTALPRGFRAERGSLIYQGKTIKCEVTCSPSNIGFFKKSATVQFSCTVNGLQQYISVVMSPGKNSYWVKPSKSRSAVIHMRETERSLGVSDAKVCAKSLNFVNGTIENIQRIPETVDFISNQWSISGKVRRNSFTLTFVPVIK